MPTVPADSVERVLARARDGTRRYRDRDVAIADGYRLIGPDFPGMGEHWIHLGLLLRGELDATRPPVLEYATIDGRPTLVGVAYALPLLRGERPPDFPSGHAWHDHTESVDEESLLLEQVGAAHEATGARIAMLHAWVWLANPAGVFASDNWTLPFARLGLPIPDGEVPAAAGRALALDAGGAVFTSMILRRVAKGSAADSVAIEQGVATARARVVRLLGERSSGPVRQPELQSLCDIWSEFGNILDRSVTGGARERLRRAMVWTPVAAR